MGYGRVHRSSGAAFVHDNFAGRCFFSFFVLIINLFTNPLRTAIDCYIRAGGFSEKAPAWFEISAFENVALNYLQIFKSFVKSCDYS